MDFKFLLNFEVHLLPFENVKVLADLQKESSLFTLGEFNWHFCKKMRVFVESVLRNRMTYIKEKIVGIMKRKSNEETKIFARIGLAGRMYKVSLLIHKKSVN